MAVKKSTDEKEKVNDDLFEGTKQIPQTQDALPEGLYEKLVEDLRRDITEELRRKSSEGLVIGDDEDYDPREDYLEKPAVFFSFNVWYGIYGDKRYGREVLPPRGEKIEFKKLYRYAKRTGGKTSETISVSQTTIRSRSVAQWVREHTKFDIKFFEDLGTAQSINVTLATKMNDMSNVISSLSDHAVLERCKREQINVDTGDLGILRKHLIRKMAEDALKNEKQQHELKIGSVQEEDGKLKSIENRSINIDNDTESVSTYD